LHVGRRRRRSPSKSSRSTPQMSVIAATNSLTGSNAKLCCCSHALACAGHLPISIACGTSLGQVRAKHPSVLVLSTGAGSTDRCAAAIKAKAAPWCRADHLAFAVLRTTGVSGPADHFAILIGNAALCACDRRTHDHQGSAERKKYSFSHFGLSPYVVQRVALWLGRGTTQAGCLIQGTDPSTS